MTSATKRLGLMVGLGIAALCLGQSDWQVLTSREGSTTVSAPSSWVRVEANDPNAAKRLEEFKANNPQLGQMADAKNNERQILFAYSPNESAKGSVDTFNILKNPRNGLTEEMYGQVTESLRNSLAPSLKGELSWTLAELPVAKALKYSMTMRAKAPSGEVELDLYCAMFLKGDFLYVATFATTAGQFPNRKPVWDKVLQSLRVK